MTAPTLRAILSWPRRGALAGALARQLGVAADNQTLAGKVVRDDLRHVALVEQRELQRSAFGGQSLDGRRAQRGDPAEAGGLEVGVDARLGDHAAVADEHDALQPKTHPQLADLVGERAGIAEIAFEDPDGDRATALGAQETEDDLRPVGAMIAAAAELRQQRRPSR